MSLKSLTSRTVAPGKKFRAVLPQVGSRSPILFWYTLFYSRFTFAGKLGKQYRKFPRIPHPLSLFIYVL